MRLLSFGLALFIGFILGIMFTVQENSESNLVKFVATMKYFIN